MENTTTYKFIAIVIYFNRIIKVIDKNQFCDLCESNKLITAIIYLYRFIYGSSSPGYLRS